MKSTRKKHKELPPGLIKTAWLGIAQKAKLEPGSIQYDEMEKSFYGGAYTIMHLLHEMSEHPPKSERELEAQARLIEFVHNECEDFFEKPKHNPELN